MRRAKEVLGQKTIRNMLRYIDLEAMIFKTIDDQWIVRVADDMKEVCALIEVGFEYITGQYSDDGKIFRKRKYVEIV